MNITFLDLAASYSHASLALPMLHLACEDVDAQWSVVRGTINDARNDLVERIVQNSPDILLATAYLFNHDSLTNTLACVRELLPNCAVILGGPEFLGDNERFLRAHPYVDAVVRGEGESVLPAIIDRLSRAEVPDLPGVCRLDDDGNLVDGGIAPSVDWPPAKLPFESEFYDTSKAFVQVESSRGCAQRCQFCTSANTGKVAWLPIDRLAGWLEAVHAAGVREVRLLDRTFNASPKHACQRLTLFRNSFPDMRFHLEIHPAFLTDNLREELVLAALEQLHVEAGIQTTDTQVAAACGRGGSSEATMDGLKFLCALENVEVHADLIVGLPEQSAATVVDDLRRLIAIGPNEVQLETLKILRGTELSRNAGERGLLFTPDPPYDVLQTDTLAFSDIRRCMQLSRIVDRFFNAPMLHPVVLLLARRSEDLLMSLFDALIAAGCADAPMSLRRRALALHSLLAEHRATDELELLSRQWLLHGLSPSQCPIAATRWREDIPGTATQVFSMPDLSLARAQVWLLEQSDRQSFFVFDKGVSQSGPAALYEILRQQ